MRLVPKFDRVLLKRDSLQASGSLIIIPAQISKANQPAKGTVIAVGPTAGIWKDGIRLEEVRVGERVIFAMHAGVQIEVGDEIFWIIQDNDVLAVIAEESA